MTPRSGRGGFTLIELMVVAVLGILVVLAAYTVMVNSSQITGSTAPIFNDSRYTTYVGASLLAGGAVVNSGTMTCAGVYDETYAFSTSGCP